MEPEHDEQLMTPSGTIASSYQSKRENFMTSLRKQENQKLFAKRRQHIMQSKQNHSTIENEIETFALFDTQLSLISGCESHAELLDEEILLKYMPHIECVSRTLETYQHSRFVKKVIESGVLKVLNCFILNYLNNSQSLHREQALHHSLHILSVCIQDDYNTLVQLDTELSLMDSLISLSRKDYTNVETVYALIECIGNVVQLKAFTKKLLQESSYNDLNALVKRKICQANKNTDTEEVEDLLTIFLWAIWSMLPPISDLDDVCFDVDVVAIGNIAVYYSNLTLIRPLFYVYKILPHFIRTLAYEQLSEYGFLVEQSFATYRRPDASTGLKAAVVNTLTEVIKLEAEDIKQNFNDIDFLKLLKQDMTPKKSEVRDKFQYTRLFKAIIKFIVALFEANDYLTNEITFDDMELEHALVQVLMDWRSEQEIVLSVFEFITVCCSYTNINTVNKMLQMNCDLNVLDLLVDVLSSDLLLRTTAVLEEGLRAINNILEIEYTESSNSRPIRAKLAASIKLGQLLESAAVKESLEVYREADEIHRKLNPEQDS